MEGKKKPYRFSKAERISSEKQIEWLFRSGKWEHFQEIRMVYCMQESEEKQLPKILISVPKKHYRKAVTRNRIKRQIREAYRLNKAELVDITDNKNIEILLGLIYSGSKDSDYHAIEKDVKAILSRMLFKVSKIK